MSKRALVTGGSAGLGKAIVDQLIGDEWRVLNVDVSPPENNKAEFTKCDLSDRKSVDKFLNNLGDEIFDLVVLNAGISATGKFEEIPFDAHAKLLRLNAETPFVLASQLASQGNMNAHSHLAFVSSLSYFVGYPGAASYAASKDAVAIYAKSITNPFKKRGIKVSCVFPGPLKTDHAERHSPEGADASNRMSPEKAAHLILKDVFLGKKKIIPGGGSKIAAMAGKIAPNLTAFAMGKTLFRKLGKNTY